MPNSSALVQSNGNARPASQSWGKNTSWSAPCANRHCLTRLWNARRCFSCTAHGNRSHKCSNSALASNSGAPASSVSACGQISTNGSLRVRQRRLACSSCGGCTAATYFRAVGRLMAAFSALFLKFLRTPFKPRHINAIHPRTPPKTPT